VAVVGRRCFNQRLYCLFSNDIIAADWGNKGIGIAQQSDKGVSITIYTCPPKGTLSSSSTINEHEMMLVVFV
jgi:hypothetical protein